MELRRAQRLALLMLLMPLMLLQKGARILSSLVPSAVQGMEWEGGRKRWTHPFGRSTSRSKRLVRAGHSPGGSVLGTTEYLSVSSCAAASSCRADSASASTARASPPQAGSEGAITTLSPATQGTRVCTQQIHERHWRGSWAWAQRCSAGGSAQDPRSVCVQRLRCFGRHCV